MSDATYRTGADIAFVEKQNKSPFLCLNAWTMQNIVYEIIAGYMAANDPETLGFSFKQKYDPDITKTSIFLDIAYNWQQAKSDKRPAIFIQRGDVNLTTPTIGQTFSDPNIKESEEDRFTLNQMEVKVSVIGTNLGFAEQLAEYVKQPLISFAKEVRRDFNLRRFRLVSLGSPKNIVDPKDHFVIELLLQTAFDEGWTVKGEHLKLKTISKQIFDQVTKRLLIEQ